MLIEQRPVSRKTPLDGKLEISPTAAARLSSLGEEFPIGSAGREGTGRLLSLACTCAKGVGEQHIHHFVESALLKDFAAGTELRVELDEERSGLRIEQA